MPAPAPLLEVVGPPPQSLPGPPEAGPPEKGNSFQGALEDSMARTADAEGHQGEESAAAPTSLRRRDRKSSHPHAADSNDAARGQAPTADAKLIAGNATLATSAQHEAAAAAIGGKAPLDRATPPAQTQATERLQANGRIGDHATTAASHGSQGSRNHLSATTDNGPATKTTTTAGLTSQITPSAALRADSSAPQPAKPTLTANGIASPSAAFDPRDSATSPREGATAGPDDPSTGSLRGPAARPADSAAPSDPSAAAHDAGPAVRASAAGLNSLPRNASRSIVDHREAQHESLSAPLTSLRCSQSATGTPASSGGASRTSAATGLSNRRLAQLSAATSPLFRPDDATAGTAGPHVTETGQGITGTGPTFAESRLASPNTTGSSATWSSSTGSSPAGAAPRTRLAMPAQGSLPHRHQADRISFTDTNNHTVDPATGEASITVTGSVAVANAPSGGLASTAATGGLPLAGGEPSTLAYAAGMQETIETINATVALANRQGSAQATIMLAPAELGALRIHLSQTGEGLTARVSAATAAGAQAIASGHRELHSMLSSLGISLRLDSGAFGHQEGRAGGQAQQPTEPPRQGKTPTSENDREQLHPAMLATTIALSSSSALIDVLA